MSQWISVAAFSIFAASAAAAADQAVRHSAGSASFSVRVTVLPRPDPRLYEPVPANEPVSSATSRTSSTPRLVVSKSLSVVGGSIESSFPRRREPSGFPPARE